MLQEETERFIFSINFLYKDEEIKQQYTITPTIQLINGNLICKWSPINSLF